MKITIIAAIAKNGVIGGRDGKIPWHLPADTRHFRSLVRGKCLLLGRVTFEEMSGWFEDETVIVLSRSGKVKGAACAQNLDEALELARKAEARELFVCGGASVYREAVDAADTMILTRIAEAYEGASKFPEYDETEWLEVRRGFHPADAENAAAMDFVWYRRRS